MNKKTASSIFGSDACMARALNLSKAAVSLWPDDLDLSRQDRVIGAAIRLGKITPEQARELVKNNERQGDERGQSDAH